MAKDYGQLRTGGERNMASNNDPAAGSVPENPAEPRLQGAHAEGPEPAWQARCLLRAARSGCLATSAKGQPFASLTTPACMPDGALLLLLSRLSEHTRHLMAEPRCSVLVSGAAETANPQTAPRVTVTGMAEVVDDKTLKARFLAVHPYATLYADFGDFATWRIKPIAGLLVGGFARAFRLREADLAPDAAAMTAILDAEADILARCNREQAGALAAIAGSAGEWRMVTADAEGFDLALTERVMRFAWPAPVRQAADIPPTLGRMAQQGGSG